VFPTRFWKNISRAATMRSCWWCVILERAMNSRARKLSRQYAATLCRYLERPQESLRQQAYELGREAIGHGLGVLDVVRVHQQALASCLSPAQSATEKTRTLRAAETFFMET